MAFVFDIDSIYSSLPYCATGKFALSCSKVVCLNLKLIGIPNFRVEVAMQNQSGHGLRLRLHAEAGI